MGLIDQVPGDFPNCCHIFCNNNTTYDPNFCVSPLQYLRDRNEYTFPCMINLNVALQISRLLQNQGFLKSKNK